MFQEDRIDFFALGECHTIHSKITVIYLNRRMESELNYDINLKSNAQVAEAAGTAPRYQNLAEQRDNPVDDNIRVAKGDYDLSSAGHPLACVFTFLFKGAAVLIYFFGGFLLSSIMIFILVIILSALDFWTVKNVTGRLLVGLRWWSDYDEKGKQIWRFESHDKDYAPNKVDAAFFWTSQILVSGFWAAMFVIKTLSFSFYWVLLVGISLVLSVTNLYGYYKCNKDASTKLSAMRDNLKQKGLMAIARNIF